MPTESCPPDYSSFPYSHRRSYKTTFLPTPDSPSPSPSLSIIRTQSFLDPAKETAIDLSSIFAPEFSVFRRRRLMAFGEQCIHRVSPSPLAAQMASLGRPANCRITDICHSRDPISTGRRTDVTANRPLPYITPTPRGSVAFAPCQSRRIARFTHARVSSGDVPRRGRCLGAVSVVMSVSDRQPQLGGGPGPVPGAGGFDHSTRTAFECLFCPSIYFCFRLILRRRIKRTHSE